jgi:DNA (cytosine-5)-methyltransferase 1
MNYLSVCSGVEAASVAWEPLGWKAVGFSEIEAFPSAVLNHHYPTVPNFGDMTKFEEWSLNEPVDLLVGGTPCQSFSIAGLRKGLADERGGLALTYCRMLDHYKPRWFVWENVPGVLSSSGGRDFGSFLGAVAELGYGFSYRVLDSSYFGVAQTRRRVFVVGYLGDWRPPANVFFESEVLGLPSQERVESSSCISTLTASDHKGPSQQRRNLVVPTGSGMRKLTPREHERLQGFPDDYTLIPWRKGQSPDSHRYKAMGNSMAVPVMHWIGSRIQHIEETL